MFSSSPARCLHPTFARGHCNFHKGSLEQPTPQEAPCHPGCEHRKTEEDQRSEQAIWPLPYLFAVKLQQSSPGVAARSPAGAIPRRTGHLSGFWPCQQRRRHRCRRECRTPGVGSKVRVLPAPSPVPPEAPPDLEASCSGEVLIGRSRFFGLRSSGLKSKRKR